MALTGTVSDFDKAGLFGLIIADDSRLLPFNLREATPALRSRFDIGTRVRFTPLTETCSFAVRGQTAMSSSTCEAAAESDGCRPTPSCRCAVVRVV
jgi:hypothetical protein